MNRKPTYEQLQEQVKEVVIERDKLQKSEEVARAGEYLLIGTCFLRAIICRIPIGCQLTIGTTYCT